MTILKRLGNYMPPGGMEEWEIPLIQGAIKYLQHQGWTDDEIVSYLMWCEHVDPVVSEDVALRQMRIVRERVELRLATK